MPDDGIVTDWKSDPPAGRLVLEAVDTLEHATPDDILSE
jgi:hypothetical protein